MLTERLPDSGLKDEARFIAECMAEALDAIGDRLMDDNVRAWLADNAVNKAHAIQRIREDQRIVDRSRGLR